MPEDFGTSRGKVLGNFGNARFGSAPSAPLIQVFHFAFTWWLTSLNMEDLTVKFFAVFRLSPLPARAGRPIKMLPPL